MNQQLRQDAPGTVYFDPQEGRPSAGTVTIKTSLDEDLTVPVEDVSVTVDSVSAILTAPPPGDDPRRLDLDDVTGIVVGRSYLLSNSFGQSEWITVAGVLDAPGGDGIETVSDVIHDYQSGDRLVGTRLSYTLDAANTTEDDKDTDYRVEWTYTVGGVGYIRETHYDVVRNPWYRAADQTDFERSNREVYARAKDDGVALDEVLSEAWEEVLRRIDAKGWRPGLIVGMERLAPPTYDAGILILAEMGYRPSGYTDLETWIDLREKRLRDSLDRALAGVKWYDKSDDAKKSESETNPQLTSTRLRF